MGTWDHDIPPGYPFRPDWASDGTYQAVPPVGLRNPSWAGGAAVSQLLPIALLGLGAYWVYKKSKEGQVGDSFVMLDQQLDFPDLSGVNYDYPQPHEGAMAQSYLWQMEEDARRLRQGLNPDDNLPGWVNSYIATSADRMQTASRYMQHKFEASEYSGYGDYGLFASSGASASAISSHYKIDNKLADLIVSTAHALGIPDPAMLANVIRMESNFDTKAVNPVSGASGLIQFMPKTAEELGTTVYAIRNMSASQQMSLVKRYFQLSRVTGGKPLNTQLDVMMAVFYPKAIGQGPGYRFSADVTKNNPGIVTAGDYLTKAQRLGLMSVNESAQASWMPSLNPLVWLQKGWYSGIVGKVVVVGGVALVGAAVVGAVAGYGAIQGVRSALAMPWLPHNVVRRALGNPTGSHIAYKGSNLEFESGWDVADLAGYGLVAGGVITIVGTLGWGSVIGAPIGLALIGQGISVLGRPNYLAPTELYDYFIKGRQISALPNPYPMLPAMTPLSGRKSPNAFVRMNPNMLPLSGNHARGFPIAISNPDAAACPVCYGKGENGIGHICDHCQGSGVFEADSAVVRYLTAKHGDEPAYYLHTLGEELPPLLTDDESLRYPHITDFIDVEWDEDEDDE